jgi:LysB family phage lysis regulatory protein
MNPLLRFVTPLLLRVGLPVLLVASSVAWHLWQINTIDTLENEAAIYAQKAAELDATITVLAKDYEIQRRQVQQLAVLQAEQQQLMQNRLKTIRNLQHENENYRRWAANELPDVVKRLRQRPAFTSARDYQQYMSTVNAMQPTGRRTKPKR